MNIYLNYGRALMWLGSLWGILVALFGFPFIVPWGLIYIFTSRVPSYGWGGPNNTAVMMLGNVVLTVISVMIFTILIGHVFKKVKEKNTLTVIALLLSTTSHVVVALISLVIFASYFNGGDSLGESLAMILAIWVYFILGVISWILLGLNTLKE